jgi:hypothetical protein
MIVSRQLRFVYLGVPRTASRAMHHALRQLPGARWLWGGLHRMNVPPRARDFFTFCCVRNPYQRLYSHYCCCWGKRHRFWAGRVRVRSFREYLETLAAGRLGGSCGSKYQLTVRGYTGENRLDAVVRYEDLPQSLLALADRVPGIDTLTLPKRGCHLSGDWRGAYSDELAKMVYHLARADFDEFGYQQESWRAQQQPIVVR